MDCSLPGSSVHGVSQAKNTGVGCHFLLQGSPRPRDGICVSCVGRWVLCQLCHQGSPAKLCSRATGPVPMLCKQGRLCSESTHRRGEEPLLTAARESLSTAVSLLTAQHSHKFKNQLIKKKNLFSFKEWKSRSLWI